MLNQNEAPDGYEAAEYSFENRDHCGKCALFAESLEHLCLSTPCDSHVRRDKTAVYFVRRTTIMSTILHPMGSLGEDV